MRYYLAIDQGTHASRACLFDESGQMFCEHTKSIQLKRISSTHIEQDANEIVDSVKHVVTKLLQEIDAQDEVAACGIAIQRSSVVAWQSDGTAISPVLSWQDTRGAPQLEQLREAEKEIRQLSGLPLSAHYGASKLHCLLNEAGCEKKIAADTLRLSPLISYLLFHILEEHPYIVDHSNAQRTQLFNIKDLTWSPRLAELFKVPLHTLPDCIPILNKTQTAHGKLAGTEIPLTAISGDQNAAIYGAGSLTAETALVNFGSGAFILSPLTDYRASKKQLSTIACSEDSTIEYVREGTINGAGSALSWLEKKYKVDNLWEQLPEWLHKPSLNEKTEPPVFINSIGGLGSPWWNNSVEPRFIKDNGSVMKTDTQAVAVIESIVFMVCTNLEIMQSEQSLARLRVSGGLSQLDGLCQRLADLSTIPVERIKLPEATARGIAWLAAGRPAGWSGVELDEFKPENNTALSRRYTIFRTALDDTIQGSHAF